VFFDFPAWQVYGHNPLMFQDIWSQPFDVSRNNCNLHGEGDELTVDHGYQPLKPQMDEGGLTLSILSTFGERCPGDAEPEGILLWRRPHHAGVEAGMSVLGLARAVAPAATFRQAHFPPCKAARARARLWYYREVKFRCRAPTDPPKTSIKRLIGRKS
jgi:hypothetical protein